MEINFLHPKNSFVLTNNFWTFKLSSSLPLKISFDNENENSIYIIHNLKNVELYMSIQQKQNQEIWYLWWDLNESTF